MMCALSTPLLVFYSASLLKQQLTGNHVALPGYIILTLNQHPVFTLNHAFAGEKQQLPIL